jgi:hypothetical protein
MPKLTRQNWETLREKYKIGSRLSPELFEKLLEKIYGPKGGPNPGSNPGNPDGVDEIDALMISLSEPPIVPWP